MNTLIKTIAVVFAVSVVGAAIAPPADASGKCRYGQEWDAKSKSCKNAS